MYISINSNDPNILKFLEENISKLTPSILITDINVIILVLDFLSNENEIKISSPSQETIIISKPFHFSQMISKINILQQKYYVKIGPIKYFPFTGTILLNDEKSFLSQNQNQILNSLVCYKEGIDKKKLYEFIWPRDKDISENKLDTHLTNLRNHVVDFSKYKLNFKTIKGFIKLDIN
jgi:DNA-binding response OmpR family regulator